MNQICPFILKLLVIPTFLLSPCVHASVLTDSIRQLPFTENWESGSFLTNGWSFPYMQGNWTISSSQGDPLPTAIFTGTPSQTNYIYALQSPWLDAQSFTCDKIYLDFDLKLDCINPTNNELFRVFLDVDTNSFSYLTVSNSGNIGWNHHRILMTPAKKKLFRLRFVASGLNAGNISGWMIDNIAVTRECKPAKQLTANVTGNCTGSHCIVGLTWQSPVCQSEGIMDFIYDDGTYELGWYINTGFVDWLGNKFPVSPDLSGILQSFDVYFYGSLPNGPDQLSIDVFDLDGNLLGSSPPFIPPYNDWLTVYVENVPFTGPFYGMVKWNNVSSVTNSFGYDQNGPYAWSNLAFIYDGIQFTPMAVIASCCWGTFMIRAHAAYPDISRPTGGDTTVLQGYNIYRKESGLAFIKLNTNPVQDTTYTDTVTCSATYYTSAVYNTCESFGTDTITAGCWGVGVPGAGLEEQVVIFPNPAADWLQITSKDIIEEIKISDLPGNRQMVLPNIHAINCRVNVSSMSNGMYLLIINSEKEQVVRKILIFH
ncbi:MAG: T9SS type A sorting domain-containing protein [Bacteroidetes bacterium]|nr:T9SS type A sorting domain-containing protein [Bacteroidota bacterium]